MKEPPPLVKVTGNAREIAQRSTVRLCARPARHIWAARPGCLATVEEPAER